MRESFPKLISSTGALHEFVDRFAENQPIPEEKLHTLRLALEELFTNMVKYSPEGKEDVTVELSVVDDSLRAHLVDYSVKQFDPTHAPEVDLDLPPEEITPGGLGIHLTLKMIDKVEYEHRDGDSHTLLTIYLGRS